jgi:hypothetical protein
VEDLAMKTDRLAYGGPSRVVRSYRAPRPFEPTCEDVRSLGAALSGTKPAFFADYPKVTRGYWSPDDLETTCAELERRFVSRSPHVVRRENACYLGFWIRSGLGTMATGNLRYRASITALEQDEKPGTTVNVSVVDRAP